MLKTELHFRFCKNYWVILALELPLFIGGMFIGRMKLRIFWLEAVLHSPLLIKIELNQPIKEVVSKPPEPIKEQSALTFSKSKENFPPLIIKKETPPSKIEKNFPNQLPVINQKQSTEQEKFLLAEIKSLKDQLKAVQAENENLTNQLIKSEQTKKESAIKLANSEALVQTEKERAEQVENKLKIIANEILIHFLKRDEKIFYQ
ncbi:hypothetical protein C1645_745773 [Glomus cerebriforme]|uniref:Uncharacterized protein n=1 Tax=Glomus cerebriforme TaxID=658196 RepID=A0A397RZP5_9GLOM|nr:hypothetical protein C1645_745773 [Glomus cerebriforme]